MKFSHRTLTNGVEVEVFNETTYLEPNSLDDVVELNREEAVELVKFLVINLNMTTIELNEIL